MMKLRRQQQQQQDCAHCPCKEEEQGLKMRRRNALPSKPKEWLILASSFMMVSLLFVVVFNHREGDVSMVERTLKDAGAVNPKLSAMPSFDKKNLTLSDFKVTKYLGRGSINVVFRGHIPDEQLARAYGLWDDEENEARRVVVKYMDTREYGHAEVETFERIMSIDSVKAQRVGLLQAVWVQRDVPNPFYCPLRRYDDKKCISEYHAAEPVRDMSSSALERMRGMKTVDVIVLPLAEERYLKNTAKTFEDLRIFFQSMMEQLMVAHEGGANNLDLQVNRNMYVERGTGRAVMFDWNGYLPVGAPAHDPHQSWSVAAPEAWLWTTRRLNAINMNIHAMDIWQAGVCWMNFLYQPKCWQGASDVKSRSPSVQKQFWKNLIENLGGNTIIPINATYSIDAREYAGLDTSKEIPIPSPKGFKPLLRGCNGRDGGLKVSFMTDPTISEKEKELAVDLLIKMLRISPADRPTARELLDHPYFRRDGSGALKKTE